MKCFYGELKVFFDKSRMKKSVVEIQKVSVGSKGKIRKSEVKIRMSVVVSINCK